MAENEKDDINSLCKKYFTPDSCKEGVTESKATLERKLWVQLEKYGKKISGDYSSIKEEDCEDILIQTISECFKNWKRSVPNTSYTAYYAAALSNNFSNENKKAKKRNENEISFSAPIEGDGNKTIGDTIEDKASANDVSAVSESVLEAKERFKFIDYCFRLKKREDWWKTLLTGYFYNDLHNLAYASPDINLQKFAFIDMEIYNWKDVPTQRQIAEYLTKDAGQLSRAIKTFISFIKESYQKG